MYKIINLLNISITKVKIDILSVLKGSQAAFPSKVVNILLFEQLQVAKCEKEERERHRERARAKERESTLFFFFVFVAFLPSIGYQNGFYSLWDGLFFPFFLLPPFVSSSSYTSLVYAIALRVSFTFAASAAHLKVCNASDSGMRMSTRKIREKERGEKERERGY